MPSFLIRKCYSSIHEGKYSPLQCPLCINPVRLWSESSFGSRYTKLPPSGSAPHRPNPLFMGANTMPPACWDTASAAPKGTAPDRLFKARLRKAKWSMRRAEPVNQAAGMLPAFRVHMTLCGWICHLKTALRCWQTDVSCSGPCLQENLLIPGTCGFQDHIVSASLAVGEAMCKGMFVSLPMMCA